MKGTLIAFSPFICSSIQTQVQNSLAPCAEASASEALLEFWLQILTTRTGWHLDPDLCYVLDAVIAAAFNYPNSRRLVMETLLMQYKVCTDFIFTCILSQPSPPPKKKKQADIRPGSSKTLLEFWLKSVPYLPTILILTELFCFSNFSAHKKQNILIF